MPNVCIIVDFFFFKSEIQIATHTHTHKWYETVKAFSTTGKNPTENHLGLIWEAGVEQ